NTGIKALMHLSGLKKEILISNLVFMIAPRINAAGRMDDARKAVQMFIADSYDEALGYAEMLHSDNTDRKEADQSITKEALELIFNTKESPVKKSTVVYQSHWHKGVVGIVASRLIEHYYRPTIVLTKSGDFIAGSARSVPGFNVYEAVHQCKDLLIGYGGHFYAAGMTMHAANVGAFQNRFEEVVAATITDELLIPEIIIDAEIELKDINLIFYNIIRQMEPFGPANQKPVFVLKNVYNTGHCKLVKDTHIKFSVTRNNLVFTGIGFNLAHKFDMVTQGKPFSIVLTLDENEWNDQKSLQMKVIDLSL
ncbi:MAG: DHHA1 domain-containing protein, partial [Flavitalea sp.]